MAVLGADCSPWEPRALGGVRNSAVRPKHKHPQDWM